MLQSVTAIVCNNFFSRTDIQIGDMAGNSHAGRKGSEKRGVGSGVGNVTARGGEERKANDRERKAGGERGNRKADEKEDSSCSEYDASGDSDTDTSSESDSDVQSKSDVRSKSDGGQSKGKRKRVSYAVGSKTAEKFTFHLNTCTPALEFQLGLSQSQLLACHFYKPDANGNYKPSSVLQAEFDKLGPKELVFAIPERKFLDLLFYVRKPGMGDDNVAKINPSVRQMFVKAVQRKFWLSFFILAPIRIVVLLFEQMTPRHAHCYPEIAIDKREMVQRKRGVIIAFAWALLVRSPNQSVREDERAIWCRSPGNEPVVTDLLRELQLASSKVHCTVARLDTEQQKGDGDGKTRKGAGHGRKRKGYVDVTSEQPPEVRYNIVNVRYSYV